MYIDSYLQNSISPYLVVPQRSYWICCPHLDSFSNTRPSPCTWTTFVMKRPNPECMSHHLNLWLRSCWKRGKHVFKSLLSSLCFCNTGVHCKENPYFAHTGIHVWLKQITLRLLFFQWFGSSSKTKCREKINAFRLGTRWIF